MRRRPLLSLLAVLAAVTIAAAACSSEDDEPTSTEGDAEEASCETADLTLVEDGTLTIGTDTPAFPPWFEDDDPTNGRGFESAVAYAVADGLGFAEDEVTWTTVPFNNSFAPGEKDFDFDINQVSINAERDEAIDFSDGYYEVNQALVGLEDSPAAGATSIADLKDLRLGAQVGTTSLDFITDVIQPSSEPLVYNDNNAVKAALDADQVDGVVFDLPTALYVTAAEIEGSAVIGQFPSSGDAPEEFGLVFEDGNPLRDCVNEVLATLESDGTLAEIQEEWLGGAVAPEISRGGGGRAARGPPTRRQLHERRQRRRSALVAAVSTIVVFAGLAALIVTSPGWPKVRKAFFDWDLFWESKGEIVSAFGLNIRIFLIAEVLILIVSLLLALARSSRAPVLFPLRVLATVYVDLLRGIPVLLVLFLIGFGVPALRLAGVPKDPVFWATTALVLSYSAYVSEVFRSGIASVHESQRAAARSLGLSSAQTMRYVLLPQGVRRVIPPLLNDFIALQKETALVGVIGPIDAVRRAQITSLNTFNYTPYLAAALLFLLMTVPLTRLTDWLIARHGRRTGMVAPSAGPG
jgi:His/Glu/Gln/Arg/opine family amino acid ABC transporter permease subunit